MNPMIKAAFEEEMKIAKEAYARAEWDQCFRSLERAHILGQRNAITHTVSHWWMLKVGLRRSDPHEVLGQIPRFLFGGLASITGRVPLGNTGGSNVGIMTPMPIPKELQEVFDRAEAR